MGNLSPCVLHAVLHEECSAVLTILFDSNSLTNASPWNVLFLMHICRMAMHDAMHLLFFALEAVHTNCWEYNYYNASIEALKTQH